MFVLALLLIGLAQAATPEQDAKELYELRSQTAPMRPARHRFKRVSTRAPSRDRGSAGR